MMSKRKIFTVAGEKRDEVPRKREELPPRQRRRRRSSSVPLRSQTVEPEKREALRRLFGRYSNNQNQNNHPRRPSSETDDEDEENEEIFDENEDPLLDSIPPNMDPEQLGFLICAQETLRFLYLRGYTIANPMFARLRSRLVRGMAEFTAA